MHELHKHSQSQLCNPLLQYYEKGRITYLEDKQDLNNANMAFLNRIWLIAAMREN